MGSGLTVKRIWCFRILLIFSPILVLLALFFILEVGVRLFGPFYFPLAIISAYFSSDSNSKYNPGAFELPSQITNKATNPHYLDPEPWLELDQSHHRMHGAPEDSYTLPRNSTQQLSLRVKKTGEVIYNVTVQTDEFGRRVTPHPKNKPADQHLIFMGCSLTLGEGVQQNETLPYRTAEATKNYQAYNLGFHGATASDTWQFVHNMNYFEGIPQKRGYAFYIYIDDHLPRYKGNFHFVSRWIFSRPYVRPDENGQATYYGQWQEARPWTVFFSRLYDQSALLQTLQLNFPPIFQQDLVEFVQVVDSIRHEYWKKFGPENPFIFVFYFRGAHHYASALKPLLDQAKIPYLDYSDYYLKQLSKERVLIPYDTHPNALAHKLVGELIAEDLKLNQ